MAITLAVVLLAVQLTPVVMAQQACDVLTNDPVTQTNPTCLTANPLAPWCVSGSCAALPFGCLGSGTTIPTCSTGQVLNPFGTVCECVDLLPAGLCTELPSCDITNGEFIDPTDWCTCAPLPTSCLTTIPTDGAPSCEFGQIFNPLGETCECIDLPVDCPTGLPTCDITTGQVINPLNICECIDIPSTCTDGLPTCADNQIINLITCECLDLPQSCLLSLLTDIPECELGEVFNPFGPTCECIALPTACPTGFPTCDITNGEFIDPTDFCSCTTLPQSCLTSIITDGAPSCALGQIFNPFGATCECMDLPTTCATGLPMCDILAGEFINPLDFCSCTTLPESCLTSIPTDGVPSCELGQIFNPFGATCECIDLPVPLPCTTIPMCDLLAGEFIDPFDLCSCTTLPSSCLTSIPTNGVPTCELGQVFNPLGETCECVTLPAACLLTGLPTCAIGQIFDPTNLCNCVADTAVPACPDGEPTCELGQIINPADPCACIPAPTTGSGSNVNSRTQSIRLSKLKANDDIIISIGEL